MRTPVTTINALGVVTLSPEIRARLRPTVNADALEQVLRTAPAAAWPTLALQFCEHYSPAEVAAAARQLGELPTLRPHERAALHRLTVPELAQVGLAQPNASATPEVRRLWAAVEPGLTDGPLAGWPM